MKNELKHRKCFEHGTPFRDETQSMAYLIPRKRYRENKVYQDLSSIEIEKMNKGQMEVRCFHYPKEGFCENRFISWE